MQSIQRVIARVLNQLRELPTTARLLIGSLMVILVMGLLLVSLYTARPDMVALPISATGDARARTISYLETANIRFKDAGTDILVPADQRYTILARLTDNELIDPDQIDFESLLEDDSPFRSREENRKRYLVAKMNVLARTISQMNGVGEATVVIDQPQRSTPIGSPDIAPSASVSVAMESGELNQSTVDAIARLVSGSHAGLRIDRVQVIDSRTGRAFAARDDDDLSATKYMDIKLAAEKHVSEMLERYLSYIPNVRVAVNAQVDTAAEESRRTGYTEPIVAPVAEKNETYQSRNVRSAAEPGVRSNAGVEISIAGGGGSEVSRESNASQSRSKIGGNVTHRVDPKGYPLKINATVSVPRSYFLGVYRAEQNDPNAEPDDAELQTLVEAETQRIRADVEPLIETDAITGASQGIVQVSMYHDFALAALTGGGTAGAASGGGMASISNGMATGTLVRYISLGGLALLSVAMMFLLVRKATTREPLPSAEELVGLPPSLKGDDSDLVGEAAETSMPMEGVELDDEELARQQMLQQINDLTIESPEESAGLIKRWMRGQE